MPSLAILSRLGVRPAIKPRLYAPMFHIPMSSPMMTRMLGLLSAACAAVAMNATHRATAHCFSIFGFGFIFFCFSFYVLGSWRESLSLGKIKVSQVLRALPMGL